MTIAAIVPPSIKKFNLVVNVPQQYRNFSALHCLSVHYITNFALEKQLFSQDCSPYLSTHMTFSDSRGNHQRRHNTWPAIVQIKQFCISNLIRQMNYVRSLNFCFINACVHVNDPFYSIWICISMYLYLCMLHMHMYVDTQTSAHKHTHVYTGIYPHTLAHKHTHANKLTNTHTCSRTQKLPYQNTQMHKIMANRHIHSYKGMHTNTYIYTTHARIHKHIHTFT